MGDDAHLEGRCPTSRASGRSRPRCTGFPFPTATAVTRRARPAARCCMADRAQPRARLLAVARGSGLGRRDHHRAGGRRGRIHSRARRNTSRCWPASPRTTASCFIADEIQTGFGRTGQAVRLASTTAWCPTSSPPPSRSPAACRSRRSPAGPMCWTPRSVGRARRHLRRQSARLRRGARGARRDGGRALAGARRAASARRSAPASCTGSSATPRSATSAGSAPWWPWSW